MHSRLVRCLINRLCISLLDEAEQTFEKYCTFFILNDILDG